MNLLRLVATGILTTLVVFAFGESLDGDFVWDDRELLETGTEWQGLDQETVSWVFTTYKNGHWQPLSWLSWTLDHARSGMDSTGYHVTNLVLHGLNGIWVLVLGVALLARAAPERSEVARFVVAFLASVLFVAHPLRVESVAWVTERRDLLSSFFLFGALYAWLRARTADGVHAKWYVGSLVLFAASLASKAWGLTLPAVLLVLAWWPLGLLDRRDDGSRPIAREIKLLLPYALLAAVCARLAIWAQVGQGAMRFAEEMTFVQRSAQAANGLLWYPAKTLWPADQSPLYLLDTKLDPTSLPYLGAFLGVALITLGTLWLARKRPAPFVAWMLFAILVSPVLGFAQSGGQAVAERYTYLSMIPLVLLLTSAFLPWIERRTPWIGIGLGAVLGLGLSMLAREYVGHWKSDLALWDRACQVDDTNDFAFANRGEARFQLQDFAGAREDFDRAIELNPNGGLQLYQRGYLRAAVPPNDVAGALDDFARCLAIEPDNAKAHSCVGGLKLAMGENHVALEHLDRAIEFGEDTPDVRRLRGMARAALGRRDGAVRDFEDALRRAPADWSMRAAVHELLERTKR